MGDRQHRSYGGARGDLLEPLGSGASSLLDVGCYEGATGAMAKSLNPEVVCWGIESNEEAAAVAARRYDKVLVGDLDRPEDLAGRLNRQFDLIVCGDVIEHIRHPEAALAMLREALSPDGVLVCSLPNIQYYETFVLLLFGRFPRRERGIFDRTHLRFFTLREARRVFRSCGFDVVRLERKYRLVEGEYLGWLNRYEPILRPLLAIFRPFFTFQYVFHLKRVDQEVKDFRSDP